jgi:bacteriorhodopsin
MLEKSYEVNFIMFVAITVLVFIRTLDSDISKEANKQLQLAGFVTMIAAAHYYLMIVGKDVITYRYFDWVFTTPILLIDLCLFVGIYDVRIISELVFYNMLMLGGGYLGEIGMVPLYVSNIVGFIPFILIYKKIKETLKNKKNKKNNENNNIVNGFFGLWSLYGINQLNPYRRSRSLVYNGLDFITKGAFALYLYYDSF